VSAETSDAPRGAHEPRRIWLCADDYGISPAVNVAIRDLVVRGRLNATSVMVLTPSFHRSEAIALNVLNSGTARVAIGLHVVLTTPFWPLSGGFSPLVDGRFLPVRTLLSEALRRRLKPDALKTEIASQLAAFIDAFGRPPDFVDGHQHVQLFPQVSEALLAAVGEAAPNAWVRQCGRKIPLHQRLHDRKGLLLDALSYRFRRHAAKVDLITNPGFAGTYDFDQNPDFAALFPRFLERLPSSSVVMCHPGFVDEELQQLDPLTTLREQEYAYFVSDAFPEALSAADMALM
jgi:predicted glycoside hydrolase/deacetylase ChbG (UPF0249 family)